MTPEEFHAARRHVETPSGRIAFVEKGEGPAAIFLHGVLVNGWLWRQQLDALSDLRRCLAVDLMGHGWTEAAPGADLTFDGQARMLVELMDALGLEQADFVANDSGTGLAQVFAAKHPDRLRSLTLTNGDVHDNWPPEGFKGFLDMVAAGGLPETLRRMLADKDFYRGPEAMAGAYERPEQVADETIEIYIAPHLTSAARTQRLADFILGFDNAQTTRIEPLLRKVAAPALVVWGTDDPFFPVDAAYWLQEALAGPVEVHELPGGRMFCPEERAPILNALIGAHWARSRI